MASLWHWAGTGGKLLKAEVKRSRTGFEKALEGGSTTGMPSSQIIPHRNTGFPVLRDGHVRGIDGQV